MENNLIRYQKLPEDFYEIIRRRKLKADEALFAIYLRGKYCRFGNPFYSTDKVICYELNFSYKVLSKIRKRLQIKGVIKYDSFHGRGRATIYTMLDTYMTPVKQQGSKILSSQNNIPPQTGKYTSPNGKVYLKDNQAQKPPQTGNPISNKEDKNKTERFSSYPKDWKTITKSLIK